MQGKAEEGGAQWQPLALAATRACIKRFYDNMDDGNAERALQTNIRVCADRLRDPFLVDPVAGGP